MNSWLNVTFLIAEPLGCSFTLAMMMLKDDKTQLTRWSCSLKLPGLREFFFWRTKAEYSPNKFPTWKNFLLPSVTDYWHNVPPAKRRKEELVKELREDATWMLAKYEYQQPLLDAKPFRLLASLRIPGVLNVTYTVAQPDPISCRVGEKD